MTNLKFSKKKKTLNECHNGLILQLYWINESHEDFMFDNFRILVLCLFCLLLLNILMSRSTPEMVTRRQYRKWLQVGNIRKSRSTKIKKIKIITFFQRNNNNDDAKMMILCMGQYAL